MISRMLFFIAINARILYGVTLENENLDGFSRGLHNPIQSSSRRFIPAQILHQIMSHMCRLDKLAFLLATSPSDVIKRLSYPVTLTENESLQYLTDINVYEVANACVRIPYSIGYYNIRLYDDLSGSLTIDDPNVTRLTPAFSRLSFFIRSLDLSNTHISEISVLAGFKNLYWINLDNTPVESVEALSGFTKLHHIGLKNTRVSNLSPLKNSLYLETIDLEGTYFDVDSLPSLSRLPNLSINLVSAQTADDALAIVANPSLRDGTVLAHIEFLTGYSGLLTRPIGEYERRKIGTLRGFNVIVSYETRSVYLAPAYNR